LLRLLFALVAFAMALWLYGKFGTPVAKPKSKARGLTVAVICLIGGFWLAWSGAHKRGTLSNLEEGELAMTAQSIMERREKGLTTVVDFWAIWCAQCESNKKLAFSSEEFKTALKEHNAVLMIADSSNENPLSDKFLAAYGQGGIPFAIVIPPKGPVIQLPTVMGSAQPLLKGLEEAKKQAAGK
jgi:thiol:disulfide interchange protein DsbD